MKVLQTCLVLNLFALSCFAQFAPPVGQIGTTAIYKDSSAFVNWATACTVSRGYQDISNPALGYTTVGDSSMVLGIAGSNGVVSLGDGGSAIVTFANPISNGSGWDFAVFENSFLDTFLELAFVEVSSDGINFFRFPATSNTQDTVQVWSFGSIDATQINNLAGKYIAQYGTPFDLQELAGLPGLDINNVTHVKIIDVVGCIQHTYASYDSNGNIVNDPWSTAFPSGGFDLDAIGVIHQATAGMDEFTSTLSQLSIYPNPITENSIVRYFMKQTTTVSIEIIDLTGRIVFEVSNAQEQQGWHQQALKNLQLKSGIYFISLSDGQHKISKKIIVSND